MECSSGPLRQCLPFCDACIFLALGLPFAAGCGSLAEAIHPHSFRAVFGRKCGVTGWRAASPEWAGCIWCLESAANGIAASCQRVRLLQCACRQH